MIKWWQNVIHDAHVRHYWAGDADPVTGKTYQLGTEHTTWFGFFLIALFSSLGTPLRAIVQFYHSLSEVFRTRFMFSIFALVVLQLGLTSLLGKGYSIYAVVSDVVLLGTVLWLEKDRFFWRE